MNTVKQVGGRTGIKGGEENERLHMMLLHNARDIAMAKEAPFAIRCEALSMLLAAYTDRGCA